MAAATTTHAVSLTQISAHIPITLDMNKMNYDQWRILFETHCFSFFLTGHFDGTSLPTGLTHTTWKQLDNTVQMWIYGTIIESLLNFVLKMTVLLVNSSSQSKTSFATTKRLAQSN